MTEGEQLARQIHSVSVATQLCEEIESRTTKKIDPSKLDTGKIDFFVQKLILEMHSIDGLHSFLKKSSQTETNLYSRYEKALHTLVERYTVLVRDLNKTKKDMAKKLYWQSQFISTIFEDKKKESP